MSGSGTYAPNSRLIWSLTNTSLGTTITASGNSGGFTSGTLVAGNSAVDLRDVTDVWLSVFVAGLISGGAPSLVVDLDVFDDQGNLFAAVLSTTALTAGTGVGQYVCGGLHTGGTKPLVLPSWGRVSWAPGTGSFPGTQIALYGR
jgi:hypothetical protein